MTDFDLAMIVEASRAGPIKIAVDFHGIDDVTRRNVICRVVLHPDALPMVLKQLADAEPTAAERGS